MSKIQVTILFADFFIALLFKLTLELEDHKLQDGYREEMKQAYTELLDAESDTEARYKYRHSRFCGDLFGQKIESGELPPRRNTLINAAQGFREEIAPLSAPPAILDAQEGA